MSVEVCVMSDKAKTIDLSLATDEQLLREIIRRNPVTRGPTKSLHAKTIREVIIGIGNDHIATILLHQDDVEALKKRNV